VLVEFYRVRCPRCGLKVEVVPQLPGKAPFSQDFEDAVGLACESAAARQVARQFGLAEGTTRAIDRRYLERWAKSRRKPVLRQLGDAQGAAEEAKLGASLAASTNSRQAAAFSTGSGKRMLDAGDLDGAIAQFRSAIHSDANYAAAHYQLGLALSRKGEKDEASREFQRASELDPHLTAPGR